MRITKFGHSCLLVEENGVRILLDPGSYSTLQNDVTNLDVILITHEHADHLDFSSLKTILANNPAVKIYTNKGVGKKLDEQNIKYELLENGQSVKVKSVLIEGIGEKHAPMYDLFNSLTNTGYIIANKLFCPGDSFTKFNREVEILALFMCAPWLNAVQAIDYAKKIKPKICFPVHDGILKPCHPFYKMPLQILGEQGIRWVVIEEGKTGEF